MNAIVSKKIYPQIYFFLLGIPIEEQHESEDKKGLELQVQKTGDHNVPKLECHLRPYFWNGSHAISLQWYFAYSGQFI